MVKRKEREKAVCKTKRFKARRRSQIKQMRWINRSDKQSQIWKQIGDGYGYTRKCRNYDGFCIEGQSQWNFNGGFYIY
jgi:hypothetical protein